MREKRLSDPVTVRINRATLKRIKSLGSYGEIIDDILVRVLDEHEKRKKQ